MSEPLTPLTPEQVASVLEDVAYLNITMDFRHNVKALAADWTRQREEIAAKNRTLASKEKTIETMLKHHAEQIAAKNQALSNAIEQITDNLETIAAKDAEIAALKKKLATSQADLEDEEEDHTDTLQTLSLRDAEITALCAERDKLMQFMDSVRDAARNRNPEGATLLDFMACWNEQYEREIAALRAENERLRKRVAELEAARTLPKIGSLMVQGGTDQGRLQLLDPDEGLLKRFEEGGDV